jgi:predicted house-cleaning noncanonical NTP pyrophosphatase (MazG superfamily)
MVDNNLFLIKNYVDLILADRSVASVSLVIDAVFNYALKNNISKELLRKFQQEKREERGGFQERVYCYLFLMHAADPALEEYRKKSSQYTEIKMTHNLYSDNHVVFTCNKLVRDNLPERIVLQNRIAFYRYLDGVEFKEALLKKLLEEYIELCNAQNKEEILEECSDMLEVLEHLLR